jgi:mannitol/fructose-specific phosphotransferase system IIA component (Ntr-type)
MVTKEELLGMIDHCIHYSGESYAAVFYHRYEETIEGSELRDEEKDECRELLAKLRRGAHRHLDILQQLRKVVERNEKRTY